jgi:hypothetical protein
MFFKRPRTLREVALWGTIIALYLWKVVFFLRGEDPLDSTM